MSALHRLPPPPRETQRRLLREGLAAGGRPLRTLAEDVRGLDGPLDLVTVDGGGRVVLVLLGQAGEDLELVAHGLAQRAWLAPRLGDWLQLAPELGLRPDRDVALMLVAPEFGPRARAAAEAVDAEGIELVRALFVDSADGPRVVLDRLRPEGPPRARRPARRAAPSFRCGLDDADLGVPAAGA